jgi:hypothetical protein
METLTATAASLNNQLPTGPEFSGAIIPPSVEVIDHAQAVTGINALPAPEPAFAEAAADIPITPEAGEAAGVSRLRQLGRTAMIRAGLEVVGMGVDLALMGAGKAGVNVLQSVTAREAVATASDVTLLRKVNGHEAAPEPDAVSRRRKIGGKVVSLTATVGAAIAAQKFGPDLVDMVHSNFNHGAGEMIVPIASKTATVAGMGAAHRRVFA